MVQVLASVLFFIVFLQLFAVLSIYLWTTLYRYYKKKGSTAKQTDEEQPTDQP